MATFASQICKNKVALITGSSRGIGRAIALELAEAGANIVLNYVRNQDAAQQTLDALCAYGVKAIAVQANVGDPSQADRLVETALSQFGKIDILVHNAALGAFKPLHALRLNQWDLSMNVNAKAFLVLVQKALPSLQQCRGHIIAISSLGAHKFIPNYGAIGISKAALENMVRYLAAELAPKGIHVNGISGGPVETDALRSFPNFEAFKSAVLAHTPAARMGRPEDLAKVVRFLVSPDAEWIYGQILVCDGGLSLS